MADGSECLGACCEAFCAAASDDACCWLCYWKGGGCDCDCCDRRRDESEEDKRKRVNRQEVKDADLRQLDGGSGG